MKIRNKKLSIALLIMVLLLICPGTEALAESGKMETAYAKLINLETGETIEVDVVEIPSIAPRTINGAQTITYEATVAIPLPDSSVQPFTIQMGEKEAADVVGRLKTSIQ